jgi:hypothetical protein
MTESEMAFFNWDGWALVSAVGALLIGFLIGLDHGRFLERMAQFRRESERLAELERKLRDGPK